MSTSSTAAPGASTPRRSPRKEIIVKSETEDEPMVDTAQVESDSSDEECDSDEESLVYQQIKGFMRSVKHLEGDLKKAREQNKKLQRQLDTYRDAAPTTPRRGTAANIETAIKMQELEYRIEELEERNSSLNKKLGKLKQESLKAEVEELNDYKTNDEGDSPDRFELMRKLLRRFSQWMSIVTLSEKEECPICYETLKPTKAYATPCDHIICVDCLPQVSRGADETVKCPQCRNVHERERIQLLRYTETQRWDSLLKIARRSTRLDGDGRTTSSEEDEEGFIDDGEDDEEDTGTEPSNQDQAVAQSEDGKFEAGTDEVKKEEEEETILLSTPPAGVMNSYTGSPLSEKRKRMENLVLSRSKRKRVI